MRRTMRDARRVGEKGLRMRGDRAKDVLMLKSRRRRRLERTRTSARDVFSSPSS